MLDTARAPERDSPQASPLCDNQQISRTFQFGIDATIQGERQGWLDQCNLRACRHVYTCQMDNRRYPVSAAHYPERIEREVHGIPRLPLV